MPLKIPRSGPLRFRSEYGVVEPAIRKMTGKPKGTPLGGILRQLISGEDVDDWIIKAMRYDPKEVRATAAKLREAGGVDDKKLVDISLKMFQKKAEDNMQMQLSAYLEGYMEKAAWSDSRGKAKDHAVRDKQT